MSSCYNGRDMKIKLHEPHHHPKASPNRFCGPGALSIILGITAENAASRVRSKTGKRCAMGVAVYPLSQVLRDFGLETGHEHRWSSPAKNRPTFARWLRERSADDRGRAILVITGNHYVVVQGNIVADNQQGRIRIGKSNHRRKRVSRVVHLDVRDAALWEAHTRRRNKDVWLAGQSPDERRRRAAANPDAKILRDLLKTTGATLEAGRWTPDGDARDLDLPEGFNHDSVHVWRAWDREEAIDVLRNLTRCEDGCECGWPDYPFG